MDPQHRVATYCRVSTRDQHAENQSLELREAEFERGRITERIHLGIARVRAQGKRVGRRRTTPLAANAPKGLTVRRAAELWGCSKSHAARRLINGECPPLAAGAVA